MDQPKPAAHGDIGRALKPFALPLGLASPMWLAYGAAASVGATWWLMSRMSRFVAPHLGEVVNAEAVGGAEAAPAPAIPALMGPAFATAETIVETVEFPAPATSVAPMDNVVETFVDAVESSVSAAPPDLAIEPAATDETAIEQVDELTLLRGVGPRVADALVARGVTTFAQLAAWSDAEMKAFDTELKLLGRSKRYDFLGQAHERATASQ